MIAILRRHPVLVATLALALAALVFFAVNLGHHARGWDRSRVDPVDGWMTVGHIAQTRGLDPREIDRIAGLPTPEVAGRPQTLDRIAAERGVPVATIIAAVEAAIATLGQSPEAGPDGQSEPAPEGGPHRDEGRAAGQDPTPGAMQDPAPDAAQSPAPGGRP